MRLPASSQSSGSLAPGQHSSHYEGLIGGVRFSAGYTVQHAWTIIIYAC